MDHLEDTIKDMDVKYYIPEKIICAGLNYLSHIAEQDWHFPDKPVLFTRAKSCFTKGGDNIVYPPKVKVDKYWCSIHNKSVKFDIPGVVLFFTGHISADFIWYLFEILADRGGCLTRVFYKLTYYYLVLKC